MLQEKKEVNNTWGVFFILGKKKKLYSFFGDRVRRLSHLDLLFFWCWSKVEWRRKPFFPQRRVFSLAGNLE